MTATRTAVCLAVAVAACASLPQTALAQQNNGKLAPTYDPRGYRKAPDPPREDAFRDLFEDPQVPVPARVPAVKPDTAPRERQPLLHVPLDAFNDPLAAPRNDARSSTSRYSTGDSTSSFSTSQGSTMGTGTVPLYTTMPPRQPAPPPYGQVPQATAAQPYR